MISESIKIFPRDGKSLPSVKVISVSVDPKIAPSLSVVDKVELVPGSAKKY